MTALAGRLSGAGGAATGFALALLVAIGIGVHNLGEGLAIGASFGLGEIQLGTFLIVGFMIHNVTEGLGIATPVAKTRTTLLALAGLVLIAGAPTILGAWIGGYTSSDVLGALFFAIAAGAAFQVVVEVGRYVARNAPGGLRSGHALVGFVAGVAVMYVTGVLAG
jgi:zinc transporter ZupT